MRTNLLKTMLVAVGLAASVGAWADDITATLSHTAGTRYGSAAGSTANTVDGEAEYYNNEGSKGWIGYAFAEFSFTIPEGQSVTSASLTWTASSSKTYGSTIYYLNSGTTLDYDAIKTTQSNYRFNGAKTQILTAESVKGSKTITTDVTDAVKDIAASQSYIIFQWTNNNGSATLAGKASSNAPVLTITTASASDMTTYTVKFVDESNNSIKADVSYDVAVNTSTTATDEDLASFFNSDKSKKYIYKSGNNAITTVSEAASNVITLVFREANKWNYSVNAVDENSTVLKTYTSGEDFEQETFSTPFNKYIVVDGTIYSTSNEKTGAWFKKSATLDSNDSSFGFSLMS